MADAKTGNNEESNKTQNNVSSTGAPEQSGAPVPSPEHPPVSHIMPHNDVVPTEPSHVQPKPPVANVMPPAPETKIELRIQPPPVFQHSVPAKPTAPAPVQTPQPEAPAQDALEAEVGLVRPKAKARPPDPLQTDMSKILKGIKLPEKRAYTPDGERTVTATPSIASQDAKKLDDILAAHITENPAVLNPPEVIEAAPVTVPNQEAFHEELQVASVHTLKQDLQHVVHEQKMSVVKAVALEQEKRAHNDHMVEPPKPPSRAPAVIFTVLIFLLLGLAALGGVYYVAQVQYAPSPSVESTSLVFAEQTVGFPLTKDSPQTLKSQLALARTSSGTLGSLLHIVPFIEGVDATGKPTQQPATLSQFFTALGIEPPENLMRALGDEFFLGVHTVDKNAPIIVIKVASYDRAFDGMLSWEKNINPDLSPLFSAVPRLMMGPDGLQIQRPFTDLVMRNYDVRALKDDQGVIQLYYSFPTRDLLVIAESPYTFTEILSRLQAGRRL